MKYNENYKLCTKCLGYKHIDDFYLNHRTNKPRSLCKDCEKIRAKLYRMRNAEKIYLYNKEYKKKNLELVRERNRKYYLANREKLLAYQKEYYIKKTIQDLKKKFVK